MRTAFLESFVKLGFPKLRSGFFLDIGSGIRSVFATILLIIYEIFVIIILFNVLIAIFNATIQKYQDRRQLYWKFARTSVWIEYFDEHSALPVPFTIINVFWSIFLAFLLILRGLYR